MTEDEPNRPSTSTSKRAELGAPIQAMLTGGFGRWVSGAGVGRKSMRGCKPVHGREDLKANLSSKSFVIFMSIIIMLSLVVMVIEVDFRAEPQVEDPPKWVEVSGRILIVVYLFEVLLRIYAFTWDFFKNYWGIFDLGLVVADVIFWGLSAHLTDSNFSVMVSSLRALRVGRVLRIVRIFRSFRELTMLIHGMAGALRAILWAAAMIFGMLLIFGMIAVEFVQPYIVEMVDDGQFADCERCRDGFSSVPRAVLTFIQTIVAGDSWGEMAIPVIKYQPATLLLFMPALVTVQLGLLNLILAVIVERASQARLLDTELILQEKAAQFKNFSRELLKLFHRIDADGNGFLTEEEVLDGFASDPAFADLFRTMGITKGDMKVIFQILNVDETGLLSYKDFVEQLHKMKTEDGQTYMLFNVNALKVQFKKSIDSLVKEMHERLDQQGSMLARVEEHLLQPGSLQSGADGGDQSPSESLSKYPSSVAADEQLHLVPSKTPAASRPDLLRVLEELDSDIALEMKRFQHEMVHRLDNITGTLRESINSQASQCGRPLSVVALGQGMFRPLQGIAEPLHLPGKDPSRSSEADDELRTGAVARPPRPYGKPLSPSPPRLQARARAAAVAPRERMQDKSRSGTASTADTGGTVPSSDS